jgi:hypothetical protein
MSKQAFVPFYSTSQPFIEYASLDEASIQEERQLKPTKQHSRHAENTAIDSIVFNFSPNLL